MIKPLNPLAFLAWTGLAGLARSIIAGFEVALPRSTRK
jgi:hypothetical protein